MSGPPGWELLQHRDVLGDERSDLRLVPTHEKDDTEIGEGAMNLSAPHRRRYACRRRPAICFGRLLAQPHLTDEHAHQAASSWRTSWAPSSLGPNLARDALTVLTPTLVSWCFGRA